MPSSLDSSATAVDVIKSVIKSTTERQTQMPTHQRAIGARDLSTDLSRRRLLNQAGWAMLAAACRPWRAFAADQISPAMTKLSTYMAEARSRALPEEVVAKVKYHVLDTIAAMVSGSELPPG